MNDKKYALNLPEGSIRALLAIILVGGTLYSTFSGIQEGAALYALTGSALTHYFNARGKIGSGGDSS